MPAVRPPITRTAQPRASGSPGVNSCGCRWPPALAASPIGLGSGPGVRQQLPLGLRPVGAAWVEDAQFGPALGKWGEFGILAAVGGVTDSVRPLSQEDPMADAVWFLLLVLLLSLFLRTAGLAHRRPGPPSSVRQRGGARLATAHAGRLPAVLPDDRHPVALGARRAAG